MGWSRRSRRRTWMFSGRLRHSRLAYREVVFNQKQPTFFACHIHAFEFFGGVSEKVTPEEVTAHQRATRPWEVKRKSEHARRRWSST